MSLRVIGPHPTGGPKDRYRASLVDRKLVGQEAEHVEIALQPSCKCSMSLGFLL